MADRTAFIKNEELIDNFLNEPIGPDKIWRLHAYDDDPDLLEGFITSMGVDFDLPIPALETYETVKDGKSLHNKIYVTAQKGVYLDLVSDAQGKQIMAVFVRLGEDINQGYIASLRNG
jgi:hypothetical protein